MSSPAQGYLVNSTALTPDSGSVRVNSQDGHFVYSKISWGSTFVRMEYWNRDQISRVSNTYKPWTFTFSKSLIKLPLSQKIRQRRLTFHWKNKCLYSFTIFINFCWTSSSYFTSIPYNRESTIITNFRPQKQSKTCDIHHISCLERQKKKTLGTTIESLTFIRRFQREIDLNVLGESLVDNRRKCKVSFTTTDVSGTIVLLVHIEKSTKLYFTKVVLIGPRTNTTMFTRVKNRRKHSYKVTPYIPGDKFVSKESVCRIPK